MFKSLVTILLFSIQLSVFSQESKDIDSVIKSFRKTYKKSVKFLTNKNDSVFFITAYNKHSHDVLGVIITLKRNNSSSLPGGQYHFYFLPENIMLLKVNAYHSDNRHTGRAEYLFQNGKLLSKKQDKYIESDFSNLLSHFELYKKVATEYINQKFIN